MQNHALFRPKGKLAIRSIESRYGKGCLPLNAKNQYLAWTSSFSNTTSFGIARDVLILLVVVHETGKTEADFEPINRIERE